MGLGWGVHGTSEEPGGLGAGQEGVGRGVSRGESLGMPEPDMKPQLPRPWSLFENVSATSQNWLQSHSPCRVFCARSC